MKIIQRTLGVDNNTFQPVAMITLEVPIERVMNAAATMTDEEIERYIGRQFLNAMDAFQEEETAVTDVESKETDETPVPQES